MEIKYFLEINVVPEKKTLRGISTVISHNHYNIITNMVEVKLAL